MPRLIRLIVWLFAAWCTMSITHAQEPEKPVQEESEMLLARVLVLDPDGHPLDGATVTPSGLRSKVDPGSHYAWSEKRHGAAPKIVTNNDGIAEVPYPKYIHEKIETGKMTWSVDHPEYVSFREDRSVDDNPAEIKLERRFRVAVTAVDAQSGNSIATDLFASISTNQFVDWKLHDNGMLVSPVFVEADCVMRVMQLVDGQPALFSEAIEIKPEGRGRVLITNVKLSKGTRVEGRLADNVPRPVLNGYVVANLDDSFNGNENRQWRWKDRTSIAEDGTFVFDSLPPNGVLQLIPVCDDWVTKSPEKETVFRFYPDEVRTLNNSISLPQLFLLANETVQPVPEMEAATSVRVVVTGPDSQC